MMNMKKNILLYLAVSLALMGTSCEKEQAIETGAGSKEAGEQFAFCVEASKTAPTKALDLENNEGTETLHAYWKSGEKVAVYLAGTHLGDLTATVDATDKNKATLSGMLDSVSGLQAGSQLDLLFPRAEWDYTHQTGAAPSETGALASQFDYALATVTVASVDEQSKTIVPASGASFISQQSIIRLSFKMENAPFAVNDLTIFARYNKLVQKRTYTNGAWQSTYGAINIHPETPTTDPLYYAHRAEDTYTTVSNGYAFNVLDSENTLYYGTKSFPAEIRLTNGIFASTEIALSKFVIETTNTTASYAL